MNHPVPEKLHEFYDGELAPDEAGEVERHVRSCAECRAEVDLLRQVARMFWAAPDVKAGPEFARSVMDRIYEQEEPREAPAGFFDFLRLPRWELISALTVSLVLFSYFAPNVAEQRRAAADPMTLVSQEEPDALLFSDAEIEQDDLLQVALGGEETEEL